MITTIRIGLSIFLFKASKTRLIPPIAILLDIGQIMRIRSTDTGGNNLFFSENYR